MHLKILKKFSLFFMALLLLQGWGKAMAAPIASSFEVNDLDGQRIVLKELRGRLVLLEFLSVSCKACQISMSELNELQIKYRDKGLIVIGLTVDHPNYVSDALLKEFRSYFKVNFKVARANPGILQDYFFNSVKLYLPTIFIIDRKGQIVRQYDGYPQGELEMALKEYL